MTQHLVRLNGKLTEFRANPYEKEKPSWGARLGKVAAVVGGGAALAGGAGYLRGRMAVGSNRFGVAKTAGLGFRKLGQDTQGARTAVSGLFDKIKTGFKPAAPVVSPFGKVPGVSPFGKSPASSSAPDHRRGAEPQPAVSPEIDRTTGISGAQGYLARRQKQGRKYTYSMKQRLIELDQFIDNPKMSRNKKIAIAAGALGAGYLGSAYYRGRKVVPDASLIDTLIAGNREHMDLLRGGPKVAAPVAGVVPPVVTGVPVRKKPQFSTSTSTGGTTTAVHLPLQTLRQRKPRPPKIERYE